MQKAINAVAFFPIFAICLFISPHSFITLRASMSLFFPFISSSPFCFSIVVVFGLSCGFPALQ